MLSADSGCPFCNRTARVVDVTVITWAELKVNKAKILGAGIPRQKVWARSCLAEQRNRTLVCPTPSKTESHQAQECPRSPIGHLSLSCLLFQYFEVHGLASAMLGRYFQPKRFVNTHSKFGLSHHVLDSTSLVESDGSLDTRVWSEAQQYICAFIQRFTLEPFYHPRRSTPVFGRLIHSH